MKKATIYLVLGLSMTACREDDSQREVINRLKSLETEVAKLPRTTPVRWAVADKDTIAVAMAAAARTKVEALKRKPGWPADLEAKAAIYNARKTELTEVDPKNWTTG